MADSLVVNGVKVGSDWRKSQQGDAYIYFNPNNPTENLVYTIGKGQHSPPSALEELLSNSQPTGFDMSLLNKTPAASLNNYSATQNEKNLQAVIEDRPQVDDNRTPSSGSSGSSSGLVPKTQLVNGVRVDIATGQPYTGTSTVDRFSDSNTYRPTDVSQISSQNPLNVGSTTAPGSTIDYTFHIGQETIDQYNQRISQARGETSRPNIATASATQTSSNITDYLSTNTTPTEKKSDALTDRITSLLDKSSGQTQALAEAEKKAGVENLNKQLTDVNNQIKTAIAERNALNTNTQGKTITMDSIIGAKAQTNAVYDAKILTLTAQAQALMGNITLAEETAQKAVDLKYAPILEEIAIKQAQLELLQPKLTKEEKLRSEAQAQALADKKEAAANKQANEKELYSTLLNQMQSYPDAGITLSDTLEQANTKIKNNSSIYRDNIRTLGGGGTGSTGGSNSGIINTILASGKFTKEQAATISNAINNGEDPLTVIKNNAKNIMQSPEATDLAKIEKAQRSMLALNQDLKDFYQAGGKTSIFSGTYENAINKLGSLTDPNLVKLATKIKTSLQSYRNAVSGTAYSEQEGIDIASIFPGINKSEGLNNAIMQARLESFNTDIDGAYRGVLGSSYDQLKSGGSVGTSGMSESDAKASVIEYLKMNPAYDTVVNTAFRDNPTWTYADVLQLLP